MTGENFFELPIEQEHLELTVAAIDAHIEALPANLAKTEHAAVYNSFEKIAREYAFHRPKPIIGVIAEKDQEGDGYVFTRIGRFPISGIEKDVLVAAYESPIGKKWAQLERLDEELVFGATITIIDGKIVSLAETNAQRAALRRERIRQTRDGSLHDITDVIDPDQDDIVRLEHDGCLVIAGGPGTGKTVVALQRLAYLIRTQERSLFDESNILVIGPTEAYMNYVKDFFPGIGILGVTNESFLSLCLKKVPSKDIAEFAELREERDGFKITKNSANILRVIQACLWPPDLRLNIEVNLDRGIAGRVKRNIDCDEVSEMVKVLYEKFLRREISYNQARTALQQEIQNFLVMEPGAEETKSARTAASRREELLDKWLLRIGLFSQQERLVWRNLLDSPKGGRYKRALSGIMTDFYQSDIEVAIEIAAEFQKIDTDKLREILIDLEAPRKNRRDSTISSEEVEDVETITVNQVSLVDIDRARAGGQLQAISQIVDRLLPSRDGVRMARLICRGDSKLYERVLGHNGKNLALRLSDEAKSSNPGNRDYRWSDADLPIVAEVMHLLDGNRGAQSYSHVVVDEAQDLTRMQCRVISHYVSGGRLTLVGDMNQSTRPGNLGSWENVGAECDVTNLQLMPLLQNYRVPQNIYDYARLYLTESDRIDTPSCDLEGGQVVLIQVEQTAALASLLEAVESLVLNDGRVAVITDSELFKDEINSLNLRNVLVLTPDESKGLEVDHAVLVQPNRWYRDEGRLRNLMYVALTRATKSVTIIQHDPDRFGIIRPTQFVDV